MHPSASWVCRILGDIFLTLNGIFSVTIFTASLSRLRVTGVNDFRVTTLFMFSWPIQRLRCVVKPGHARNAEKRFTHKIMLHHIGPVYMEVRDPW